MSLPNTLTSEFRRYAGLIEQSLERPGDFVPESENPSTIQIERGVILCHAVQSGQVLEGDWAAGRLIELADSAGLGQIVAVDRLGHYRPVYRPLLIYAWLASF